MQWDECCHVGTLEAVHGKGRVLQDVRDAKEDEEELEEEQGEKEEAELNGRKAERKKNAGRSSVRRPAEWKGKGRSTVQLINGRGVKMWRWVPGHWAHGEGKGRTCSRMS